MLRYIYLIFFSIFSIQLLAQDVINISNSNDTLINNINSNITTTITSSNDSVISLYDEQIDEIKILLSECIISDHTLDTLSAMFNFKLLFESLAQIDEMNDMDEFEYLEYNKILKTAVDYYEKKALTINKIETAIAQAYEIGLLGENILGSGFSFDLDVSLTGESYVAGEETALMDAIEGKRAMPRSKPPFPAAFGVWGKPTNINNVKTLAYIPSIIENGGEWFKNIGVNKSTGTAIICLSGKINNPGLYEVPLGISIGQVINQIGGGAIGGNRIKLLQTGGPLGGVLGENGLEINIDFDEMAKAGAILGSGGIIVADQNTCAVDLTRVLVAFCQYESCGKCFPCRLGMSQMLETVNNIAECKASIQDLDKCKRIGGAMQAGSLCGHGQLGFNPIRSALQHFKSDFDSHVIHKKCPTGGCESEYHFPVSTKPYGSMTPPNSKSVDLVLNGNLNQ